jgi:hypothetical protein
MPCRGPVSWQGAFPRWQQSQALIADITTDQFDATMKTNLYAMCWITKPALASTAGGDDHQHRIDRRAGSARPAARSRVDQGRDHRVHAVAQSPRQICDLVVRPLRATDQCLS